METKEINIHSPAHSTFPVQDQFNQVHMFTGLSKLEWMAGMIAQSIVCKKTISDWTKDEILESYPMYFKDHVAPVIVQCAMSILKECDSHKPEVKSPLSKI